MSSEPLTAIVAALEQKQIIPGCPAATAFTTYSLALNGPWDDAPQPSLAPSSCSIPTCHTGGPDRRDIQILQITSLEWLAVTGTSNLREALNALQTYAPLTSFYLALWASHPLALGATPQQVCIDGIAQLTAPYILSKPASFQKVPNTPNFDKEVEETLKYDGLPPLEPTQSKSSTVVLTNVMSVFLREEFTVREAFVADSSDALAAGVVVVRGGQLACASSVRAEEDAEFVDLEGGSIAPWLVSTRTPCGLQEIDQEAPTQDGYVFDPLTELEGFASPNALLLDLTTDAPRRLAYRAGVTAGIAEPQARDFLAGLNIAFSTGARHKLEKGAFVQEAGAAHFEIHPVGYPSVSTQIAALRHLFLSETNGGVKEWLNVHKDQEGSVQAEVPLVVDGCSADIIASVPALKAEVEAKLHIALKFTIICGSEAHLLARELGVANVGAIHSPARVFPNYWVWQYILGLPYPR
ncbi:hypothetical protein V8D89_002610 [Ganoderma adspersum]